MCFFLAMRSVSLNQQYPLNKVSFNRTNINKVLYGAADGNTVTSGLPDVMV